MMQPVQGTQSRLSSEPPVPLSENNAALPITSKQLRILTILIDQLSSLTGQQEKELWILLRRDLGITQQAPLLSRHFPLAEQNLNLRLTQVQQSDDYQKLLHQISELISKNNNRHAVSDYLTQQFGRASLNGLTSKQLQHVLSLLQNGQLNQRSAMPDPIKNQAVTLSSASGLAVSKMVRVEDIARLNQARLIQVLSEVLNQDDNRTRVSQYLQQEFGHTLIHLLTPAQQRTLVSLLLSGQLAGHHPAVQADGQLVLSPSELKTLNQLVVHLASRSQQPLAQLWQTILGLIQVPIPQQIPARYFAPLTDWLLIQQNLTQQNTSTLHQLQQTLAQTSQAGQWQQIISYAMQQWQATEHTVLNESQWQELSRFMLQIHLKQASHGLQSQHIQPGYNPMITLVESLKTLTVKPGLIVGGIIVILFLFWVLS